MRYTRLIRLCVVISAAALPGLAKPALAVVIFEENFAARAHGTGMFGQQPTPINAGSSFFVRSSNLANDTLGRIGHYGDQSLNIKGLLFEPRDVAGEEKAGSWGQNMTLPYDYTFGTDKVRLTVKVRTYDPYDNDGISYWNNFAIGFTDTDHNLTNFILLKRNPNNINRTHAQIFNNAKIYQTNLPAPAVNAEFFRELVLEYDPTKVNISGTNPYSLIVDGLTYTLNSVNNVPTMNPVPPDVGLPPMTTDGGQTFNRMRGIGWGFWFPNEVHPTSTSGDIRYLPKSALIESIKFETIPQSVPQPGDENGDGIVDARDYVVWRKSGGPDSRYQDWKAHFSPSAGSSAQNAAVPEPAAAALLLIGLVACGAARRRRCVHRGIAGQCIAE